MSTSTENVLTKLYGGKFANQMVYRTRDGVSILAKVPKKSQKEANNKQLATRRKFKMASKWAKKALQDPIVQAEYAALASGMKTPYIMAITNYLRPPVIDGINPSKYTGEAGSIIEVLANDDFKLKGVTVEIIDASGTLIESGPCEQNLSDDCWEYTATVAVANLTGVTITAVATDIPNHKATLFVTL